MTHPRIQFALAAIVISMAALPPMLPAQDATGTIRGRVTEAGSGRGVGEVQLLVSGTRIGAVSGAGGEYTILNVPAGDAGSQRSTTGISSGDTYHRRNRRRRRDPGLRTERERAQSQ